MKKLFAMMIALAALTAWTGPAAAQLSAGRQQRAPTPMQADEAQKKKDAEKMEQEYQATMRKTQGQGDQAVVVDPWANMRAVDGSQPKR